MKIDNLDRAFTRIGARVKFREAPVRWRPCPRVERDEEGPFYLLDLQPALAGEYEAMDLRPRERSLILAASGEDPRRYLCSHDGKSWRVRDLGARVHRAADISPPVSAPVRTRRPAGWTFLLMPNFQPTAEVRHRAEQPVDRCGKRGFVAEYECEGGDGTTYVRGWVWRPDEPVLTLRLWHAARRV